MSDSQPAGGDNQPASAYDKGRDMSEAAPALAAWLASKVESPVEVSDLVYPTSSGASNETILFTASWKEGIEQHNDGLVLRIHPREDFQLFLRPRLRTQFDLLKALQDVEGVPVPEALWYEEDPSIFGLPFFIMRQVEGRVPTSLTDGWFAEVSSQERRRLWVNAVRQMVRIHQIPLETVSFLADVPNGVGDLEQFMVESAETLAWASDGLRTPVMDGVFEWLTDNMPRDAAPGLAWGDSRLGNLMFDDRHEVTAVLDWEQATLGGGLTDLGWWLFLDGVRQRNGSERLEGVGSPEETIALWGELSGQSTTDVHWYHVFAGFRVSMIGLGRTGDRDSVPEGTAPEDGPYIRELCRLVESGSSNARN